MQNDYYHQLANQFMSMWQDQSRAMMQDERFLDSLLEILTQMNRQGDKPHAPNAPRSAARDAAVSPGAGDERMADFTRRLERVEATLAKLQAGNKKKPAKPQAKRRKPAR